MDTNSLRLFVLAADKRNISAAGRALGIAPAVASARLAKLEHELGTDLLHRSTRKVSLSTEGSDFLPFAREIIAQEDAARSALGQGEPHLKGTLRFTAPSTFAQLYIAPILPTFMELHPDVTLDLRLSDSQMDLIEGSFDLALRNMPMTDTSLKGRKLADDHRMLCAAPRYLAHHGTPSTPDDLRSHRLLAFRDTGPRLLIGPDGATHSFHPRASHSPAIFDDGLSMKLATVAGAGISANSLWSVRDALDDGRLVQVLPDWHIGDRSTLWLVYPKANVLSPKVRAFIDFLTQHLGDGRMWNGLQ